LRNGKQSKLIGKIILADFLEYRLEKFKNFVQTVERRPLYRELTRQGIIMRKPLSIDGFQLATGSFQSGDGVIAKIRNDIAFNFTIDYTNEAFSIQYVVDEEKLQRIINNDRIISNGVKLTQEEKEDISGLLHKLRRISTRNRLMHEILKGIVECQKDYFKLDLKLKPLSKAELARILSNEINHGRGFVIDASRISRVTKGICIITPQGKEVSLKTLFPSNRDIARTYIKTILGIEREDIRNGLVKRPYTDEELRLKLEREYNLSIIKRGVGYCRKELGILPYSKRLNSHGYPPLWANFSNMYPFTISSVKKTLLPVQGHMNLS